MTYTVPVPGMLIQQLHAIKLAFYTLAKLSSEQLSHLNRCGMSMPWVLLSEYDKQTQVRSGLMSLDYILLSKYNIWCVFAM